MFLHGVLLTTLDHWVAHGLQFDEILQLDVSLVEAWTVSLIFVDWAEIDLVLQKALWPEIDLAAVIHWSLCCVWLSMVFNVLVVSALLLHVRAWLIFEDVKI